MSEDYFDGSIQTLVFDCPVPGCDVSIIGRYIALKRHLKVDHTIANLYEDRETEKTYIDEVDDAQSEFLERRIENEMVVTDGGEDENEPCGFDRAVCSECGHVAYLPESHPDGVVSCTDCGEGVLNREVRADAE